VVPASPSEPHWPRRRLSLLHLDLLADEFFHRRSPLHGETRTVCPYTPIP
jgi:hypothetical protein